MEKIQKDVSQTVKFFPIFLGATLAAIIDATQTFIDETIIGNLFDDVAFGAINLLEPYNLLVDFMSYLICVGGTALIVRARGSEEPEEMKRLYNHSVTCCLIVGVTFSALYAFFDEQLVTVVAQDSLAYPYALKIFFWTRFNVLITPLYDFLFTYVLYIGSTVVSSTSMLVKMGVNTALSIYLGNMVGIAGVTCATFISNGVGLLILLLYIIWKNRGLSYRPYINPRYIKRLALLGLGESSFFFSIFILEAGVNALALRYYSIQGIAVVAVLINLYEVLSFVSEGISEYETAAVNQALGEKNREGLRYGMRVTFRAVLIESTFFSLLFLIAAPLIIKAFDIDDAETARLAILTVRIMAVPSIAIITARVTAVFHQYTEKIGHAIFIWIFFFGVAPLLIAALLCNISLAGMVWGVALGPVLAVALLWLLPAGRKDNAAIRLRRTTVVFDDEEVDSDKR